MQSDELEQWLLSLPLDEPCMVAGEQVYLSVGDGGAEIGLVLLQEPSQAQVLDAMRTGFQGALDHAAGLALAPAGDLVLNRWMPGVEAWSDVADALEDLLNQGALWRAAMAPGRLEIHADDDRVRRSLAGG